MSWRKGMLASALALAVPAAARAGDYDYYFVDGHGTARPLYTVIELCLDNVSGETCQRLNAQCEGWELYCSESDCAAFDALYYAGDRMPIYGADNDAEVCAYRDQ